MDFEYNATPTASRFHLSDAAIKLLIGAVGTGKTVALCVQIMMAIITHPNSKVDGKRKSKWLFIRNTYPELRTTTVATWLDCFPEGTFGYIRWDSPITYFVQFNDIEAEVIFLSIDKVKDLKKLMSLNVTHAAINEARFLPEWILEQGVRQRVGRYPNKEDGYVAPQIIMDTNPPTTHHWIYKRFEEQCPPGYEVFRYPPAVLKEDGEWQMNPLAENIDNLPGGADYYLRQIPGSTDEWIKVYLGGQYGTIAHGKPIYPEYNDQYHYSRKTQIINRCKIGLGFDWGRTPACVITQLSPTGRLIVHEEITSEDMGVRTFAEKKLLPLLNEKYPMWRDNYIAVGDPAGSYAGETDEDSCMKIMGEFGIRVKPASTNAFKPRRESVAYFLTRFADSTPAFVLSENCPILRSGFLGAYHYDTIKLEDEEISKEKPVKNTASHPHDALQYIALEHYGHRYYKDGNYQPLSQIIS